LLVGNMKNNKKTTTGPSSPAFLGHKQMNLNLLTLSFPPEMEKTFFDNYFEKSLNLIKIGLLTCFVFFSVFGILDAILLPQMKKTLWVIRYAFICPYLMFLFVLSYSKHFKKIMQPAVALAMVWCGLGIIAMIIIAPPPVNYSYYAGLILVLYGFSFIRVRFIWSTLAGWTIVGAYQIGAIFLSSTPLPILINNNFFFVTANIIGMCASYTIEYYFRRDFFLARLLEDEKEKVKNINLELEQRVQKRTAQLNKTNEDLLREMEERKNAEKKLLQSQKMQAIGTLAGGIAHDFNNILTAIIGYSELGLFKKKMDDKKTQFSFEQIHKAGERARDLVKQILTFSRQEEEKYLPVNLGPIIKETLKLIRATIPKNIDINSSINAESDLVLANSTQIHQVLMNLCTNAAHSMKDKAGVLSITLEDTYLSKKTKNHSINLQEGPYLDLKITDTGTGIEPSVLEQIFDPFFTTKNPGEGTGMGLSVVHGIIESHGGTITIETEPDKGSNFHILLPKMNTTNKISSETTIDIPTGRERILFIDDEESVINIGKEMLEEFGYTVTIETSPTEGLNTFCNHPTNFDLVITDKNMPDMTGFELAEKMLQIQPNIPIILCSGYSDRTDIKKARAMGFKESISKPLLMSELANTVREVLDKNKITQTLSTN